VDVYLYVRVCLLSVGEVCIRLHGLTAMGAPQTVSFGALKVIHKFLLNVSTGAATAPHPV
jgi:hypothetical protein